MREGNRPAPLAGCPLEPLVGQQRQNKTLEYEHDFGLQTAPTTHAEHYARLRRPCKHTDDIAERALDTDARGRWSPTRRTHVGNGHHAETLEHRFAHTDDRNVEDDADDGAEHSPTVLHGTRRVDLCWKARKRESGCSSWYTCQTISRGFTVLPNVVLERRAKAAGRSELASTACQPSTRCTC